MLCWGLYFFHSTTQKRRCRADGRTCGTHFSDAYGTCGHQTTLEHLQKTPWPASAGPTLPRCCFWRTPSRAACELLPTLFFSVAWECFQPKICGRWKSWLTLGTIVLCCHLWRRRKTIGLLLPWECPMVANHTKHCWKAVFVFPETLTWHQHCPCCNDSPVVLIIRSYSSLASSVLVAPRYNHIFDEGAVWGKYTCHCRNSAPYFSKVAWSYTESGVN